MSKDGKPLCANCGTIGHHKTECPKPKAEPGKRPCFKCSKTGHTSAQCKSGLPAKALESEKPEDPADPEDVNTFVVHSETFHPLISGARHFWTYESDDESDADADEEDGIDDPMISKRSVSAADTGARFGCSDVAMKSSQRCSGRLTRSRFAAWGQKLDVSTSSRPLLDMTPMAPPRSRGRNFLHKLSEPR